MTTTGVANDDNYNYHHLDAGEGKDRDRDKYLTRSHATSRLANHSELLKPLIYVSEL